MNPKLQTLTVTALLSLTITACGGGDISVSATSPSSTDSRSASDTSVASTENPETVDEAINDDTSAETPVDDGQNTPKVELADIESAIIGSPVAEAETWAEKNGMFLRVVKEDGEEFALTEDYSLDRINVVVDNGVVTTVDGIG